jgi:hypothetical protein
VLTKTLRIALGDMHALDAEAPRKPAPVLARLRLGALVAEVGGEIEQRLLDEPGDHARIGAAAGDRGRSARIPAPLLHHRLAQRVVGARLVAEALVVIEPRPRLDDGVDVERADLAAKAHDVERGGVDREVDAEALALARLQIFAEGVAIVVAGEAQMDEFDAALVEQAAVRVVRVDDDEMVLVEFEMALDQRQRSLADRSEADHDDRAFDAPVQRPVRHGVVSPSGWGDAERLTTAVKATPFYGRQ